jgi:hypothetical protein
MSDEVVFKDAHSHVCIRLSVGKRHTEFIENDGHDVDVHKMPNETFDRLFSPMLYDVGRATKRYLDNIGCFRITGRAFARLTTILKEDSMAEKKTAPKTEKTAPKKEAPKKTPVAPVKGQVAPKSAPAPKAEPKAKAAPKKEEAAEKTIGRKRDNQKIKLLSATNPKRTGSASFDRFELYKTCKTTDDFLAKGGRTGDLRYDEAAGFIELN